ncbi:MAG TPA: winged helix DNA-binding domain-containing protein [Thermomicrobiales bacterium]|nr:winged helix DNA-binding domain-containing protein [Thermomicrobiales bacterium]
MTGTRAVPEIIDRANQFDQPLSQKALNRALLARQLLLTRQAMPALDAIEHLVGMQAQAPMPPYFGLWTRLEDFQPGDMADLITNRHAVRIALMRSTVHLVSARDCLMLRPLLHPVIACGVTSRNPYGRHLEGLDLDEVVAAGRSALEARPQTLSDLGKQLQTRWPERDADALGAALRSLAPLVQLPPRGIWGAGGQAICTTAEAWLDRPLDTDPSIEEMVLRYLAAFGPATVKDVQAWSGLTKLRAVVDRLRPRLVTFRNEAGQELFDLPDAPRPAPDTPAPVRFLPEWDNILLSHADRTRIIADNDRQRTWTVNGIVPGSILLDGFVAGTWKITRERSAATLRISPFQPLSDEHRAALHAEGEQLLTFAAPDTGVRAIEIASPV